MSAPVFRVVVCLVSLFANWTHSKQIVSESFTRRHHSRPPNIEPVLLTTDTSPQIAPTPTATQVQRNETATTVMSTRALLATLPGIAWDAIVNRSRPVLLAPQIERKHDRFADDPLDAEAKYFYEQPRPSFRPVAANYDPTHRHYIDYRKVYGIRYNPNKIRRSFALAEQAVEPVEPDEEEETAVVPPSITTTTEESLPALDSETGDGVVDSVNMMADSPGVNEVDAAEVDEFATESGSPDATEPMVTTFGPSASENEVTDPPHTVDDPDNRPGNSSTAGLRPASTASTTHIMAPSRVHTTLQFLKDRVAGLLANGLYTRPDDNGQRFLSLFNVIKFANIPCASDRAPLRSLNGTCYNRHECDELGGVAVDECAGGYGVCCVFQYGCGGVTRQNISYFKSPNYPAAHQARLVCTLTLELWPNVRQVLVELLFFELKPPVDGTCSDDQFVVTGQNVNSQVPILCGINSGQHMYVNVEASLERKLFLSVLTNSATSRAFNIRVSQLQEVVAPAGCLQYYTDNTGFVQTFNYDDVAEIVESRLPSYFNNLNYAICIRRAADFCTIAYANEIGNVEYPFQLINVDQDGVSVIPPDQAGAEIFNCADDFIAVNGIRLCGEKLNDASLTEDFQVNAPVTDLSGGPIVLPVRTNEHTVGRGFKMYFEQQPC